jgi:acyl-coenzyme A thioesterase PaaI-like protein
MDTAQVAAGLLAAVPYARTLGLEVVSVDSGLGGDVRAVVRLPDAEKLHNHVGGPHAGALFSLGETASGAVVLAAFDDLLDRAVPLAVRADIVYRRLAIGAVYATAVLKSPVDEVRAGLDDGLRPRFEVAVEIATEDGEISAEMTVQWALRPNA